MSELQVLAAAQDERKIWQGQWCEYTATFTIAIKRQQLPRNYWEDPIVTPQFTIEDLLQQNKQTLGRATEIRIESDVLFLFEPFRGPTIQDCGELGKIFRHFENVCDITLSNIWSDHQIRTLLDHLPHPKQMKQLNLCCKFDYKKEERIVATLQKLQVFTSLETLVVSGIKVDNEDCAALGRTIASFQHISTFFLSAKFPSYKSYLILFDEIQFRIPVKKDRWCDTRIGGSVIEESIPVIHDGMPEEHRHFYREMEAFTAKNACNGFSDAASQHLWYYESLNRAGRSRFLQGDTPPLEEWVDALGNESIVRSVLKLYYFLRLRPDVYAGAALAGNNLNSAEGEEAKQQVTKRPRSF